MANPEHLAILTQGVEEWNKWRREHPGIRADFTGAYISETSMDWAEPDIPGKLGIADLEGFNLRGASFAYARLQGAILRNADLFGANLRGANLRRADLRGADLRQAKFLGTNLTLANLSQANVAGAIFWETVLARVNMNGTIGLKDCHHGGPSVLDERTMRRSGGLPVEFLRGCGVSEAFIRNLPRLVESKQFHSCFISYSSQDQEFAERLHAGLQVKGVRCWFAPHDLQGEQKISDQIDEAILRHDKLLLILSKHSMTSEWVKTELGKALKREKQEGKRVLFPLRVVSFEAMQSWEYIDSSGKDLAEEIRQYFIPDFSEWDKDNRAFQGALQKLVRDLNASGNT
jgi:uncharacterized protein YjbI with pentapeptide repeats